MLFRSRKRTKERQRKKYILGQARPALLSLTLAILILLSPIFPLRSQQKKLSYPRVPQERQDRGLRSAVPEHGPHRRGPRASFFAQPPNPLPHGSRLAGPSRAHGHEVRSGLALAGIAEPASIRVDLFHSLEARPKRSMAGEELVILRRALI